MTEEWGKAMFYCINLFVTFKAKENIVTYFCMLLSSYSAKSLVTTFSNFLKYNFTYDIISLKWNYLSLKDICVTYTGMVLLNMPCSYLWYDMSIYFFKTRYFTFLPLNLKIYHQFRHQT
jgi:hypothetical protein